MSTSKTHPEKSPNPVRSFINHFLRNLLFGSITLIIILLIGMWGFHRFEHKEWLDSYLNAAMIVSGVGISGIPETVEGKFFVATYSIIGGATFLLVVAVVFAPIIHWLFRQVKVEDREHFKS